MVNSLTAPQEKLRLLRQVYIEQLPDKIAWLETTWSKMLEQPWDTTNLKNFHCQVHRLVGTSATFGAMELSDRARNLEDFVQAILASKTSATSEERKQVTALLTQLKQFAAEANPEDENNLLVTSFVSERPTTYTPDQRLIFLVEDDAQLAEDLVLQLSYFGYTVRCFEQLEGLTEAIVQTPPAAIVMDIMFPEGKLAGTRTINQLQRQFGEQLPVMFISARGDLAARLQAVRAGGAAYFTKPIDIGELLDKLDALTTPYPPKPFRVLIVEDDAPLADYYASVLEQAEISIETAVVTDPLQVMQPLVEFYPDLILIDVYMPHCNGLELAAVIRQQEAYISIPIVFLSSETNVNKQLRAMRLGGDDFLTKPIRPDYLISAVIPRLERSRSLRSLMVRDSLTGLLNHTKTKEQLGVEVKRAKRENTCLAFAMIDIDRFKAVNDTYGHLTGDRAIKSLSRLLQQRLRKTDIIGRYGGEEFAVIFPDTDAAKARQVLNEIREGFSQLRLQAEGVEFSITFSGGIAAFPQYGDASRLNNAADKALYLAKRQGRNQIVVADEL